MNNNCINNIFNQILILKERKVSKYMENDRRKFKYNNKDFIFVSEFKDEKYGEIVKAITTTIKDFERLYFKKENENLSLIEDKETLKYIKEKYEKILSDVIFSEDDLER